MKEYKLKRWYPGLPKDWGVGMSVGLGDYLKHSYFACNSKYTNIAVPKEDVESNSIYWEEIIEELCVPIGTKFYYKNDPSTIYTVSKIEGRRGLISWESMTSGPTSTYYPIRDINYNFNNDHWRVIKEEVKVGDYITLLRDFPVKTIQIIHIDNNYGDNKIQFKYRVGNHGGELLIPKNTCSTSTKVYRLATPEEIAAVTPLFTTEDGKKMYQGDSWWYVIPSKLIIKQTSTTTYKGNNTSNDEIKRFSTEALAKEYLVEERPCVPIKFAKGRLTQEQFSKLTTQVSTREILNIISKG